jgi:hypothetical protein
MKEFVTTFFGWVLPLAIPLFALFLSYRTSILRDAVSENKKDFHQVPYSFARTQLLWWSVIIISCFCAYYGQNGLIFDLSTNNYTYLVLMGISVGTSATAKIIDNTDIAQNIIRHQDINNTQGFLFDILSDDSGVSVHRFQAMVFNLIFGLMFIFHFIQEGKFLALGGLELTLMGLSSATYVGLKLNENAADRKNNDTINAADSLATSPEEADLIDIDESYHFADDKIEQN